MVTKRKPTTRDEMRQEALIPKPKDVPLGYDPNNPWLSADKLERDGYAETLTKFISGITQPYVLAINSKWGHGKSLF